MKRKLISPQNGLIAYLNDLKLSNSYEKVVRLIQRTMEEMDIDTYTIKNQNSRKVREWINGATPSYDEAITLAKMNNIESNNLKELFYSDNSSVFQYFKVDIISLLNYYNSKSDVISFMRGKNNKFEAYQGRFNKKETIKNATIIAIGTVIFDMQKNDLKQERKWISNPYDQCHAGIIPYANQLISSIDSNSFVITELKFKLLNQIIIDSKKGEKSLYVCKRNIKLTELSTFLNCI